MKNLWEDCIGILKSFYKKEFLFCLIFISALTYTCVATGFDWNYFLYVEFLRQNYFSFFLPALMLGALLPIFSPIILVVLGLIFKKVKWVYFSFLLAEAAFFGWFLSSTLKAFTGRIHPNPRDLLTDISTSFNFGFWEHGIFWGWPSSHTSVAFSVSFALIIFIHNFVKDDTKKNIYIGLCLLWAMYVGAGISFSIHWFSDFLAGMILGTVIGNTVGKYFINKYKEFFKYKY